MASWPEGGGGTPGTLHPCSEFVLSVRMLLAAKVESASRQYNLPAMLACLRRWTSQRIVDCAYS